jgi:hypothetical protein
MNLEQQVDAINSREDFCTFVARLLQSLKESPDSWENDNLESFLAALEAWVGDMDGYFRNIGEPCPQIPSWKLLGQMLVAARVYE